MRTLKHRYSIRGPVVLMIGLSAAICASGASVYIRDPGGTTTTSPSQASRSAAGWYEAQADLSSGTFKALSSTQTFTASSSPYVFTYAGIRSLVLTNTSTNSFLDIAVGNLSANFNGTFGFAPSFPAAGSATVQGVVSLSVAKNCLQSDPNCHAIDWRRVVWRHCELFESTVGADIHLLGSLPDRGWRQRHRHSGRHHGLAGRTADGSAKSGAW